MNKLEEQLAIVVEKSIAVAEKTGEFVIETAPELLQEFYTWHLAKNCFWLVLVSVGLYLLARLPYIWCEKEKDDNYTEKYLGRWMNNYEIVGSWVYFAIAMAIGSIIIAVKIYNILFILVAPKLYLIEYFAELLTPSNPQ